MEVPGRRYGVQGCDEDRQSGVHCEPCEENNRQQPATGYCVDCNEFICSGCQQTHRGSKISRHHNILDQNNMPRQKLSSGGNFCPKHDGKLLEYYCRTHGEFLCGVCVNLNHRQCLSVDFIKDAAAGFVNSKEYKELLMKMENVTKKLKDCSHKHEADIDENTKQFEIIFSDIRKFREYVNITLDTLEKNMIEYAKCLREENTKHIESTKTKCETSQSEIKAIKTDIENSIKYKQDQQLLITAKKAKTQVDSFDYQVNELSLENKGKLKQFQPHKKILEVLNSYESLGTLEDIEEKEPESVRESENQFHVFNQDKPAMDKSNLNADSYRLSVHNKQRKQSSLHSKEPQTWKASFQGEIRIGIKQDKGKSYITSGIELEDGIIVLVDNNNSCLKSIDTQKKTAKLLIQLPHKPWDISLYRKNQYVVSTEGKLSFVNIDQVSSLDRDIQVDGDLRGVVYHIDNFIVSCAAPNPCVKIVDIDGRVIIEFQRDKNGLELFVNPWYLRIIPNQNTILVSDFENHAIIGLNMNGNVLGKYCDRNLKGPTGLAVNPNGIVFLTGRKSHNVHMISGTCSQIQLLLHRRDGEELPQSPILCKNQEKLFISHNWRTRFSNTLSVYNLH